jgi:CRP-like cAMP-binding protein
VDMRDGGSAETSMIGNEGLVGGVALLGPAPLQAKCFMQIAGTGLRVPLTTMERCLEEVRESRHLVSEFLQSQMIISAQSSACNRLHEAEARLARWLLMLSDRAQSDVLNMTQESIAQMLGTQRSTIAFVAGILQRIGYIQYGRGRVRIADRAGLTTQACECYAVTKRVIDNLYSHRKQTFPAAA